MDVHRGLSCLRAIEGEGVDEVGLGQISICRNFVPLVGWMPNEKLMITAAINNFVLAFSLWSLQIGPPCIPANPHCKNDSNVDDDDEDKDDINYAGAVVGTSRAGSPPNHWKEKAPTEENTNLASSFFYVFFGGKQVGRHLKTIWHLLVTKKHEKDKYLTKIWQKMQKGSPHKGSLIPNRTFSLWEKRWQIRGAANQ